jgi:hypothetical protein
MTDATHNADTWAGTCAPSSRPWTSSKHFSLSKPDALEANHPMTNMP